MSRQGMFALSTLLQSARIDATQTVTYNISPTISNLAATLDGLHGFEILNYANDDLVILNIPQTDQENNFQFVLNTVSGGWSQFTGWDARCWTQFNNTAFFGSNGDVMIAFIGFRDSAEIDGTGGDTIIATALTAFDELAGIQLSGVRKHVKQLQPMLITGDAAPVIRIGVNTDYDLVPIVGSSTINPITGAVWDTALWDNPGSTWVGSLATNNEWVVPRCWPGVAVAVALSLSASAETKWVSTTWMVEPGNIYG